MARGVGGNALAKGDRGRYPWMFGAATRLAGKKIYDPALMEQIPNIHSGAAPGPRKGKGALVERTGSVSERRSRERPLAPEEFVERFQESAGVFWCIAAGILNDRYAVEDVLQESALIALRKLDDFDPSTSLHAWCGQIVRNVARNRARRDRRRRTADADLRFIQDERRPTSARDVLDNASTLRRDQAHFDDAVLRALDSLDETARACLLLRTLKDLSYREIAKALDIPEGTASSHVHRARRALRDKLDPDSGGAMQTRGSDADE